MRRILATLLVVILCDAQSNFTRRAQTTKGVVRGFHVDYGTNRSELFFGTADIFLGIPFAQPPVGALRFQFPQPICKYGNEVGMLTYASRCAQANSMMGPPLPSSEDCLYLNVFTPNITGKFPVMVWIHDGAFMSGGADDFNYKGAVRNFISNGVVVVTIQYRLGPFGFFTTYTPEFPANIGLFDQIMALRWVKEEISSFGGDPEQITLFGESAGAISISALSLSPLARGLFNRLIMDSGSTYVSFFVPNDLREPMERLRAAQWCNVTADPIASRTARSQLQACLANLTTDDIDKYDATGMYQDALQWSPVRDGLMFPEDPEVLMRSRPAYDALLLDMPAEEALFAREYYTGNISAYGPHSLRLALLNQKYGYLTDDQLDRMVDILTATYKASDLADDDHMGWFKLFVDAITAERFTFRGRIEADWLKQRGSKTYLATFTYDKRICGPHSAIPGYDPTTHFTEVCYLWFTPDEWEKAASEGKVTARDLAVADNFARVYTQFAKNGTTGWPESSGNYRFMNFDDTMRNISYNWRAKEKYVFSEVLPQVIGDYPPVKLSPIIHSVLKNNGEMLLKSWEHSLSTCLQ